MVYPAMAERLVVKVDFSNRSIEEYGRLLS